MHQNLTVFRMAHALASHAGARQAVIAQNIANADTPGYRPLDVTPFSDLIGRQADARQKATRARHLNGLAASFNPDTQVKPASGHTNPNGNAVALEEQMMHAVEVKRQHDRALAIYKSTLGILRTSLGRR